MAKELKKETIEEFKARGGKIQHVKAEGTGARWMKWDDGKAIISQNNGRIKTL